MDMTHSLLMMEQQVNNKFTTAYDFEGYEETKEPPMDFRRKERERLKFYRSGKLKSVYLNEKTPIKTLYGDIEAELVSFYENGAIKRIFPRYGALSAYWSEKEEAGITDYIDFYLGGKSFRVRPHNILFYETGEIRSVTIYNCDTLSVNTKYGIIRTNIGLSFYKNGEIESIEPAFKTQIEVDGKVIRPFYFLADGMHADHNSLVFDGNGNIISYYGKDIDLKGK
nr:hypothetical protein [uncultured Butyrivibrio sp.]